VIADHQIDRVAGNLYETVTVEITTADVMATVGFTDMDVPIVTTTSYYVGAKLFGAKLSHTDVAASSQRIESSNSIPQSTTNHIATRTFSFPVPMLENATLRNRVDERIVAVDEQMAKAFSVADKFQLRLERDRLMTMRRLYL
jgi:hypothetical protein